MTWWNRFGFWAAVVSSAFATSLGLIWLKAELGGLQDVTDAMALLPPFALYLFGILIFLWILTHSEISLAQPITASLALIVTVLGGNLFLGEEVHALTLVGFAAILVGIWLVAPRGLRVGK